MKEKIVKGLGLGIYSLPKDPELIPEQSAQDSLGWVSSDGQIELCRGRLLIGAEETTTSSVQGHGFGYRADGTAIQFRKTNTKIQYYNTSTELWVDVVTGLTDGAEYTFSQYSSLAGTFIYATGADGIYKIHTANPGSYTSLYDAAKNFKGKSIIATARMHMWDLPNDKTGHYGSHIDEANYTTVAAEVIADTSSGTLAFKAGGAVRTCFGVVITDTSSGEVFRDDYNGNLVGSLGGTGTINYTTGAFTTSQSGAGTADYQWENSNNGGVTDFTYSGTRVAGEGFLFRQDEGGGKIQVITVFNGKYYSIKDNSVYELALADTDETGTNLVFRRNVGIEYWRSAVSIGKGIIFMDTSNAEKPRLTILQQNVYGDNVEPYVLAEHFDFSEFYWDQTPFETYGEYIAFSGRTKDSSQNNRLFLYNVRNNTVDVLPYGAKTIVTDSGNIYIGDVSTFNVYAVLSGFDDDGSLIENYWISNDEMYGSEYLKKLKRLRLKGLISPEQEIKIYLSYDGEEFEHLGTISGSGSYVDLEQSYSIGSTGIGTTPLGGETDFIDGSFYLAEIRIPGPKFRKRTIKIEATGIGYVSINMIDDFGIMRFQQKIPSKYRVKPS